MSHHISAPNYTQVPNILFDYWMDKLSPGEWKVICCIARKTFGWGKEIDTISLKQIEKMTHLHRSSVIRGIETLIDYGLVIKIKSKTTDGDDAPNQYKINVIDSSESLGGSRIMRPEVVASCDQRVVASCDPQKNDLTKETSTKETTIDCRKSFLSKKKNQESIELKEICDLQEIQVQMRDLDIWTSKFEKFDILEAITLLLHQIKLKKNIGNHAAWINSCLNKKWVKNEKNIEINRKKAEFLRDKFKWTTLTITKQYCRCERSHNDWIFNVDPLKFEQEIEGFIEKTLESQK